MFNNGYLFLGVFIWMLGFWPLRNFCYYICVLLGFEKEKNELFNNEDDLEDETLYEIVELKGTTKGLVLLRNLDSRETRLYRLTCAPANIFRGKDAKNFSQMKKASK